MATILQQQLAQIAANSTHQLDLKAQKARHSESLLYEPREAASQSFDTIYQTCYEGFSELCALDSRFAAFERNLFSEQSKNEDRTQMTKKQNEELNKIIESFLGLVGGRLLLKPAIKTVEWLVRRFRVQEYNGEAVLFTFLPYHTSHIFTTVLSIMPEQLPVLFRFLQPYKTSLQNPPRSAILSAMVEPNFFTAFNNCVLKVAKTRHHSAILLGFWASITAQGVNGMIDTGRSGRASIRKEREERLLLQVLPVLQSALSVSGVPELYFGACMIITVLATKTSLEDKALDAMIEAVASSWTEETMSEGLMCLAVVAEEKDETALPRTVVNAVISNDETFDQLIALAKTQRVSKLIAGVAMGCIRIAIKKKDSQPIARIYQILGTGLLPDHLIIGVLEKLMNALIQKREIMASTDIERAIYEILNSYLNTQEDTALLENAARSAKTDLASLQLVPVEYDEAMEIDEPDNVEITTQDTAADDQIQFETSLKALPALTEDQPSFLDTRFDLKKFQHYADAFQACISSKTRVEQFSTKLRVGKDAFTPRLTFLARVWSSQTTVAAKVASINAMTDLFEDKNQKFAGVEVQELFPYLLNALSDPSSKVRQAGAELSRTICEKYESGAQSGKAGLSRIYGTAPLESRLKFDDARILLRDVMRPALEDAVLDKDYLKQAFADVIDEKRQIDVKKSFRSDLSLFLASHVATPVMRVKVLLLQILKDTSKAAAQARSQILLPFVREYVKKENSNEMFPKLSAEGSAVVDMDRAVLGVLSHRTEEEVDLIKRVAGAHMRVRDELIPLAFERLRQVFPSAKGSQIRIVSHLLALSLGSGGPQATQEEALPTLRSLEIPTEVLVQLVEGLPKASDLQESPPAKKRRTSNNDSANLSKIDLEDAQEVIRRITVVLELVEGNDPENHPQLLRGLFHTLSELHHFKTLLGSELVYTSQLLLGCILSVVDGIRTNPSPDVDRTVIRTDLIVDCVRATSSAQIHNTALLLVSSLAGWAPELVLHCVMPLFTFMSSTLLRQSDSFSAHVTDQTVERIVPPLAANLKKKGKSLVLGASELLLSFAAAFEHIPLHRRAGLFKHLVQTLGADETLFAVVAMLVERYPGDAGVLAFASELMNQFSGFVAIKASRQYLDLVSDSMKAKRNLSNVLLSLGDKSAAEILASQATLLAGLASLLVNGSLRKQLAIKLTDDDEDSKAIRSTYASLLEHTMKINRDLTSNASLKGPADAVLLSVLGLMPMKDFIESSAQLMQTGTDQTRQQVFRALEARVGETKANDTAARQIFLDVLPNCGVFLRADQPVETRHAAISCIDQICEKYGKTNRAVVLEVARVVAGDHALGSDDSSLRIISILCLASMIEVLADECIPILPNLLTQVLGYQKVDVSSHGEATPVLQHAGFSLLNAVLDHLPWMFADEYLDQALPMAENCAFLDPPVTQLQEFGDLAAKKIGSTQSFSALQRNFQSVPRVGEEDNQGMRYHLDVLHKAVQHHSKATITSNARVIFNTLYDAFDLRRRLCMDNDSEYDSTDLFDLVVTIALDVTLKVNDATFRPFFTMLVDWATKDQKQGDARCLRLISLYSFSHRLFDQLKSIVTNYAGILLESVSEVLQKSSTTSDWDDELLNVTMKMLSSSFENDQDDYWQTPAHFDAVALPLIGQLQKSKHVIDQTVTTITDLASAARSQEHLKAMNGAIMAQMRSDDADVRLAAVKCQRSLTERLAVDWLDLLPEMLPIISELHEDDDEGVERETLRWAAEIEEVTGERLDAMLV